MMIQMQECFSPNFWQDGNFGDFPEMEYGIDRYV